MRTRPHVPGLHGPWWPALALLVLALPWRVFGAIYYVAPRAAIATPVPRRRAWQRRNGPLGAGPVGWRVPAKNFVGGGICFHGASDHVIRGHRPVMRRELFPAQPLHDDTLTRRIRSPSRRRSRGVPISRSAISMPAASRTWAVPWRWQWTRPLVTDA